MILLRNYPYISSISTHLYGGIRFYLWLQILTLHLTLAFGVTLFFLQYPLGDISTTGSKFALPVSYPFPIPHTLRHTHSVQRPVWFMTLDRSTLELGRLGQEWPYRFLWSLHIYKVTQSWKLSERKKKCLVTIISSKIYHEDYPLLTLLC